MRMCTCAYTVNMLFMIVCTFSQCISFCVSISILVFFYDTLVHIYILWLCLEVRGIMLSSNCACMQAWWFVCVCGCACAGECLWICVQSVFIEHVCVCVCVWNIGGIQPHSHFLQTSNSIFVAVNQQWCTHTLLTGKTFHSSLSHALSPLKKMLNVPKKKKMMMGEASHEYINMRLLCDISVLPQCLPCHVCIAPVPTLQGPQQVNTQNSTACFP